MLIRNIIKEDFSKIIELNNSNTPAVSELDRVHLNFLVENSFHSWIIENDNSNTVGFCLIFSKGVEYSSDNYRWVSEHYDEFQYLDRVVIAEEFRGKGFGRKIYESWFEKAKGYPLLLEVNVKPRNEGSILFHERMGFKSIGEQDTEYGKKRVQYMLKEL